MCQWPTMSSASPDSWLCFLLRCSAMQNLREAIAGYRARLLHEGNDVKRNALLQVTRVVLWMLSRAACAAASHVSDGMVA